MKLEKDLIIRILTYMNPLDVYLIFPFIKQRHIASLNMIEQLYKVPIYEVSFYKNAIPMVTYPFLYAETTHFISITFNQTYIKRRKIVNICSSIYTHAKVNSNRYINGKLPFYLENNGWYISDKK